MSKGKKPLLSNITVGADIEVFLQHKTSGEIVSAEGIIKGSKDMPFQFKDGNPFFATSLDNVMAEFCIPPAKSAMDFSNNIQEAVSYIETVIPKELKVFAFPSARLDEKYLKTENAMTFGCDPDYNVWKFGIQNPRPTVLTNMRSSGGHIHVGYEMPDEYVNMDMIKAMDIFLGLPSILKEPENERKQLYGKAGAYRHKMYGVEYRTISNYYISSPELTQWAFNATMQAAEFVNSGRIIKDDEAIAIETAINTNSKELAHTMMTYFGVK